jgi:uncharacterized SAM-binding protein YcdF (DUF218 family)
MFFYISKILGYFINPLAWIIILFFLVLIIKSQVAKKRLGIAGFALLLFFTNPFIGDEAIRCWERPDNFLPDSAGYEYGVLLGGDIVTLENSTGKLIFRSGADRFMQTLDLYNKGTVEKIIISGGSGHLIYSDRIESLYLSKFLLQLGFPSNDMLFEGNSRNTYENAVYTHKLLTDNSSNDTIVLITSALHMKRAAKCFSNQGLYVVEYPTSRIVGKRLYNLDHLLIPSIMTLKNWDLLIHEVIGYWVYKLQGYC